MPDKDVKNIGFCKNDKNGTERQHKRLKRSAGVLFMLTVASCETARRSPPRTSLQNKMNLL